MKLKNASSLKTINSSMITDIVNDELLDWWEEFFDEDGNVPVHDMSENDDRFMNKSKSELEEAYDRAMGIL